MSITERIAHCKTLTAKLVPSMSATAEIGGVTVRALKDNVALTTSFSGSAYEKDYQASLIVSVEDLKGVVPCAGMEITVDGVWRRILGEPVFDPAGVFVTLNVGTHAGTIGAPGISFTFLAPQYTQNASGDTVTAWVEKETVNGELKLTSQDERISESDSESETVSWNIFISPMPGISTRMRVRSSAGTLFAIRSIVSGGTHCGVMTLRCTEVV